MNYYEYIGLLYHNVNMSKCQNGEILICHNKNWLIMTRYEYIGVHQGILGILGYIGV